MPDVAPAGSVSAPNATPTNALPRNPINGQFLSEAQAATELESLLSLDDLGEAADGDEAEAAPDAQAEEAHEVDPEEEGSDELEAEESESDDEGDEAPAPPARKYTVRIDGKDEQVELSELLSGYQRQADYTRKTQGLANDRKGFEQEQTSAREERAEYAKLLPQLRQMVQQGQGPEPDWARLQAEDRANGTNTFAREWAIWQHGQRRVQQIRAEEQRVAQRAEADKQAQDTRTRAEQLTKLRSLVPEMNDPKAAKARIASIEKMMRSVGYGEDDLAINDALSFVVADKAARYDELMAQRPALRQKMLKAPIVKPGGGSPAPRGSTRQALARLDQSGSVADAANLLERML